MGTNYGQVTEEQRRRWGISDDKSMRDHYTVEAMANGETDSPLVAFVKSIDAADDQGGNSRGDINQHAAEQERARRDLLLALCEKLGCEIDQLPDRVDQLRAGPGGFGWAINQLKMGKKVARQGWNGAGMFVYLVNEASYPAQTGVAKAHFGENALVPYRAYLALKTAQGDVATWAPSCSDALAEDWVVIE